MHMSRIMKLARLSLESVQEAQRASAERALHLSTIEAPTNDIVNLVQSHHSANESIAYLEEVASIGAELGDLREVSEVINQRGGLTLESLAFFSVALNRIADRTGLTVPAVLPSVESYGEGVDRVLISVEALDDMISAVNDGTRRLETNSVEATERMLAALGESLPKAHDRIKHLLEMVDAVEEKEGRPDCTGKMVVFGDGLNVALSVNGEVPENLNSSLHTYLQLGSVITTDYQEAAYAGAMKAVGLPDLVSYESNALFWENAEKIVCDIEDPRRTLTEDHFAIALPNGEPLFSEAEATEKEGEMKVVGKIRRFVENRRVNEQLNNPKNVALIEKGAEGYGRVCLSLDEVRELAKQFDKLHCSIDMCAFAERSKGISQDQHAVVTRLKEGFAAADINVKVQLTDHFNLVTKYLETVYRLASWPVLNYLANLVFTTNAFVLYAERSLALPDGEVEAAAPAADPAVDAGATDGVDAAATPDAAAAVDGDAAADVAGEGGDDAAAAAAVDVAGDTGAVDAAAADGTDATDPTDPAAGAEGGAPATVSPDAEGAELAGAGGANNTDEPVASDTAKQTVDEEEVNHPIPDSVEAAGDDIQDDANAALAAAGEPGAADAGDGADAAATDDVGAAIADQTDPAAVATDATDSTDTTDADGDGDEEEDEQKQD